MPGQGEPKTSPRRVTAKQKRLRAVRLRMGGATYEQIAQAPCDPENGDMRPLYSSRQMAHKVVTEALREIAKETDGASVELRALEVQRLDSMHMSLWPGSQPTVRVRCPECDHTLWREPDQHAIGKLLEIQKRRAALLGLDAVDQADNRLLELLEQQAEEQAETAHQAMIGGMQRAGLTPEMQREVMTHVTTLLREAEAANQA